MLLNYPKAILSQKDGDVKVPPSALFSNTIHYILICTTHRNITVIMKQRLIIKAVVAEIYSLCR